MKAHFRRPGGAGWRAGRIRTQLVAGRLRVPSGARHAAGRQPSLHSGGAGRRAHRLPALPVPYKLCVVSNTFALRSRATMLPPPPRRRCRRLLPAAARHHNPDVIGAHQRLAAGWTSWQMCCWPPAPPQPWCARLSRRSAVARNTCPPAVLAHCGALPREVALSSCAADKSCSRCTASPWEL